MFARTGNVSLAGRAARCGRRAVYGWLDAGQRFKQLYAEAHADAMDAIELEAHRRAVDGVDVLVFHGGVQVGAIRRYTDALLALLLKPCPQVYGDRVEQNGMREPPTSTRANVCRTST
jgi:hypothetical protein